MSLTGNIRLEYYKENGSIDRFINKANSTMKVHISSSAPSAPSASASASSLQLNIAISSNNDINERIVGNIFILSFSFSLSSLSYYPSSFLFSFSSQLLGLLDNTTHIISTFKHQGKLTIRLTQKRLNILISGAQENDIDSVVSAILQKHDHNKENIKKGNSTNTKANTQQEALKKLTTIFQLVQNKANANAKNMAPKKVVCSSALTSSPPILGKKKSLQKSPPSEKKYNNNAITSTSSILANNSTPNKTPVKKKIRFGLTPTKEKSPELKMKKLSPMKSSSSSSNTNKKLTKEQAAVHAACFSGESVFFTGKAGTGKSFLLNHIVSSLEAKHGPSSVQVTALTGLAALAIGGTTIHQFAGIGAMYENGDSIESTVRKALSNIYTTKRWRETKVLLIDEVSMMSNSMIELLDLLAQQARGNTRPMGGIQVVFAGDFFQLPPILKNNGTLKYQMKASQPDIHSQSCTQQLDLSQSLSQVPNDASQERFCFQSPVWNSIIKKSFVLKKVFRQSNSNFVNMLDHIREGNLTEEVLEAFNSCVGRKFNSNNSILPTQILTHRLDVDRLNEQELNRLDGEIQEYRSTDTGEAMYVKMLQTHCPAKSLLKLKLGSQVILVKTIDASDGLMNGSRGIIEKFTKDRKPVVRFCDGNEKIISPSSFHFIIGGKIVAQRLQIPLDLAWGISVHKSQGMTVDRAIVNLRKVFEYGQAYVALSRVRSLEGLHLVSSLNANQIKVHPAVINFYRSIDEAEKTAKTADI